MDYFILYFSTFIFYFLSQHFYISLDLEHYDLGRFELNKFDFRWLPMVLLLNGQYWMLQLGGLWMCVTSNICESAWANPQKVEGTIKTQCI